ncbi:MAG: redoxin domain-containing protein [Terriglobales bacterium]
MSRLQTSIAAIASAIAVSVAAGLPVSANWTPREGRELIGKQAPEFIGLRWLNSEPLTMAQLRGKVVLIRFWLADCKLCENSAPALNYLYKRYGKDGLVVIGIHHPKSEAVKDPAVVQAAAHKLGFTFPIAIDNHWQTINRFWLAARKRSYTSASLLIDRNGVIRWIHDGGTLFMPSSAQASDDQGAPFRSLEETVQRLLAEKGAPG